MDSLLKVVAYSDTELTSEIGDYTVRVDPDAMAHAYAIDFDPAAGTDAAGTVSKFRTQDLENLSCEFVIDSTGAVPGVSSVEGELTRFRDLVYAFDGKIHSPNYLKVVWRNRVFQCRLSKMDISYRLFSQEGTPLRATVSVTFKQHCTPRDVARLADAKSADLTHLHPGAEASRDP